MSDDSTAEVKRNDRVVYNGRETLVTQPHVHAIEDAVDEMNEGRSNNRLADDDEEFVYDHGAGYYPGDHVHYVDLSGISDDLKHSATIAAQVALARRGLMFNTVGFDPVKLHVVRAQWLNERQPGMGSEHA